MTGELIDQRCPDPTGLRVVELEPQDSRWESYASGCADALPYQLPVWSQVLQETFGFRSAALACLSLTGQVTGVLPLLGKKSLLTGSYLSSLPCTPVAGPYADDPSSLRALVSAAVSRTDDSAARWLQLKTLHPDLGGQTDGLSRVPQADTYVLDLPDDPEKIRFGNSRNHSNVLRMVRQAERQGVTVRNASSLDDVRNWYRLYLDTMRFYTTPPKPFRLFEVMWAILYPAGRLRLLLAERQTGGGRQLLAGCLYLINGRMIVFAFNGRDHSQLHLRPNDAIHWRAINDACAAGLNRYDFGEAAPGNSGLQYFKEKWGSRPEPVYGYKYPRLERGTPGPGVLGRTGGRRVWQRLPLTVTEQLGGLIYRRL